MVAENWSWEVIYTTLPWAKIRLVLSCDGSRNLNKLEVMILPHEQKRTLLFVYVSSLKTSCKTSYTRVLLLHIIKENNHQKTKSLNFTYVYSQLEQL